jgi:hypothetical protein
MGSAMCGGYLGLWKSSLGNILKYSEELLSFAKDVKHS